ncbi:hypothetical protein ANANG_G00280080 [Anguilla anguilla]|uniref:Uncharacterized protein n=1 Tax=Anguilla anguilla TaxID=7936 RepID=A0A9D3RKL4_ANGAN|nr:hypothetical protein ANANG_G00280080 [Anguilla anguilla]
MPLCKEPIFRSTPTCKPRLFKWRKAAGPSRWNRQTITLRTLTNRPSSKEAKVCYPKRQSDITAETIMASSDGSCFTDLSTFCTGSTAIFIFFITEAILL